MFKILLQTLPIVNLFFKNLEKGDLVEKDILVRNMVSNLAKTRRRAKIKCLHFIFRDDEVLSIIDAQKRVIFEIKSPFNLRLEPEFSFSDPVGEGRVDILAQLCMVVDWCLEHPEYTAKLRVIPKKDYPLVLPCIF